MKRFSRVSMLRAVAAAYILVACTQASGLDGSTVTPHGLACKAKLGAIALPGLTFNCQDGTVIPMVIPNNNKKTCEKPPWLELGGNDGQCVEGARLLKLQTENTDTDAIVICRRYKKKADPVNDKMYEDVALIAHNNVTGETCFFQAVNPLGMDGTDVPSPMADPSDAAEAPLAKRAQAFWKKPDDLKVGALRCSICHDNDVWMHTPYIDQVKDHNAVPRRLADEPADTWNGDAINVPTPYSLVEQAFFVALKWPEPNSVLTAKVRDDNKVVGDQVCIDCHRISNANTKDQWLNWATDNPANITDQTPGLAWTYYRWMPEKTVADEAAWHKSYDKHIRAMECCLNHPNYSGCATMPIFGIASGNKPQWGNPTNGVCIDDTGEVALRVAIDSKTVAARKADEDSCEAPLDKPAAIDFRVVHARVNGGTQTFTTSGGKKLGYRIPADPAYEPEFQVFPGDRVEIKLLNTTAWDKDHNLLSFDRWSDADSGGPGDPNKCPCENSNQATCRFRTRGPSNWFGTNPGRPERPASLSDPPNFQCIAQFKKLGECKHPGSVHIQSMIVNGGFEEGVEPGVVKILNAGSQEIVGWTVLQQNVDYVAGIFPPSEGVRFVDLDGSPGFGAIFQMFQTDRGKRYRVAFDLAANDYGPPAVKRMRVSANGSSQEFTASSRQWKRVEWDFIADNAQTMLVFTSLDTESGYYGPLIDNVVVQVSP